MIVPCSFQLLRCTLEIKVLLQRLMKLILRILRSRTRLNLENDEFHAITEKIATESNVDSRFDSIARENPEFDACVAEMLDCVGDSVLETIFDCRAAEELEFSFDFIGYFLQFRFSFVNCRCGDLVFPIPFRVILF
jgi:hypothetical protein